jgi:hypothetical protein
MATTIIFGFKVVVGSGFQITVAVMGIKRFKDFNGHGPFSFMWGRTLKDHKLSVPGRKV